MHFDADEIQTALQTAFAPHGYELLGIESIAGPRKSVLRVFVDTAEKNINARQLGEVGHLVLDQLRLMEIDTDALAFEISSPGLNRRLFTAAQCVAFIGQTIVLKRKQAIEGRQRYKGILIAVENDVLHIQTEDAGLVICPWHDVAKANVVADLSAYLTSEKKGNR